MMNADNYENDDKDLEEGLKEGCILTEFSEVEKVNEIIDEISLCVGDLIYKEKCDEVLTKIVDEYLEQAHLIDPHLDQLLKKLLDVVLKENVNKEEMDIAFRYLYLFAKLRGYKNLTRKFPHEVKDIEPILSLLSKQTKEDPWETSYMLLLWLSMICLIPFDMKRFDDPNKTKEAKIEPISVRIIDFGKMYLLMPAEKTQEAASVMLAKFLTRPDISPIHLKPFVDWCLEAMQSSQSLIGVKQAKGCLRSIALIFKFGKREELYPMCSHVLHSILKLSFLETEITVLRTLAVKCIQRIGMALLKPRVASWRYQRGNRFLDSSLTGEKAVSSSIVNDASDEDDDIDVPDDIETVVEVLLIGLKDKYTVVRWSSAKGIGRITNRLPKDFANDVLESILSSFTLAEESGAWHGGCLSLAELGRRGLLLPERLHQVVPVLVKSLNYDERHGASSVGSNVRDAACYLAWAFARAYEPTTLLRHIPQIARSLLITALFDREVNCRRAASAAFQENVGRQGSFPHGIDIVTLVDYFSVGNRSNSYTKITPKIAAFGDYTNSFIDHLVDVRLGHWDEDIRWLAAKTMNKLTRFKPHYVAEKVLDKIVPLCTSFDQISRHGSIIMVAEIFHALNEVEMNCGQVGILSRNSKLREIFRIVKILKDASLFNGLSGEKMRSACSHLITRISECSQEITIPRTTNESWAELLHDTLSNLHRFTYADEICNLAISALSAMNQISLTATPFASFTTSDAQLTDGKGHVDDAVQQYLDCLKSETESKRCGYAQAVGSLPKPVLEGRLMLVLERLFYASQMIHKWDTSFADSRRDAIKALNRVCQTVGVSEEGNPEYGLCCKNVPQIYDVLFTALEDYTRDSRGDVGSYVRGAAITALHDITTLLSEKKSDLLSAQLVGKIMKKMLRQACEKIHKTRELAVANFASLLHNECLTNIPDRDYLQRYFPASSKNFNMVELFKRLTKALNLDHYAYETLLGLVVSVGDLTQSLAEASSKALLNYLRNISCDVSKVATIQRNLTAILKAFLKNNRIYVPLFKTLNKILVKGCFEPLNSDEYVEMHLELLEQIKSEIFRTTNAQKVILSVPIFSNFLFITNQQVRTKVLYRMMIFLCHRFPIVRKTAATQLYEKLNIFADLITDSDQYETTCMHLLEIEWDQEPIENLKPIRDQICLYFKVPVPQLKSKSAA